MPDRRGINERKKRNRRNSNAIDQERKLKDKASARAKRNDEWRNSMGGSCTNDANFDDDSDQSSDDYQSTSGSTDSNSLPICDEVFNRAHQPIVFEDYHNQASNEDHLNTLANQYEPRVLASYHCALDLPEDHTSIEQYEPCVYKNRQIPYYREPEGDPKFLPESPNSIRRQPKYTSLLPLLITAHRNNVDISRYNIISERNSFRKIAMNNKDYVVGIQRVRGILFLRRHDNRHDDLSDAGHRFKRMCTPDYHLNAGFYQLVEGNIGTLKTLITADTDAVRENTQQAIELKSRLNGIDIKRPKTCWLQAFLSGVTTLIVGHRTGDEPPRHVGVREYDVPTIIDDETKNATLGLLDRVLRFLQVNVKEDGTYLFTRRYDQRIDRDGLYLYKVSSGDEQELTFITQQMLDRWNFTI